MNHYFEALKFNEKANYMLKIHARHMFFENDGAESSSGSSVGNYLRHLYPRQLVSLCKSDGSLRHLVKT